MTIDGKLFPSEGAARAAIQVAENTWTPPTYSNVGPGPHIDHASLPPQRLADPTELDDGWAVLGATPASLRGDVIDGAKIKRKRSPEHEPPGHGQASPGRADPKAPPESGIVARPGAQKAKAG
jgi:hypothetical protein